MKNQHNSRGFALIAALLIMVLLSGVAVGLLFMVNNEGRMSGNGLEDNLAYYGAESGMEKLSTDLAALYQNSASPTDSQVQNLISYPPDSTMVGAMNYSEIITYSLDANGSPKSTPSTISAGNFQGLAASIIPMTLQVTATRPIGASVNITRRVEVALIPVFQFGVFCGYDCSYFAGPDFSFGGRVHTNGNLFLASGSELDFNDKVSAYRQILTDELENGHPTASGYGGTVKVSTAAGGCPLNSFPATGPNCTALLKTIPGDASWSGGVPSGGLVNSNFASTVAPFNGYFTNSTNGATKLNLPFVQNGCDSNPAPCTDPIQIIRKPLAGSSASSTLSQSQLYNKAEIRVLLADTQLDLHPERGLLADGGDVQFGYDTAGAVAVAGVGTQYWATAQKATGNWVEPVNPAAPPAQFNWATWPLLGETTTNPVTPTGAWIRVEYLNTANPPVWVPITTQWLGYGFGRFFNTPPTTPNGGNTVNQQAILILQQLRQGKIAANATGLNSQYNWDPINFYDTREGEMRDNANGCAVNGVMNAVELDVGNLGLWLAGKAPYTAGSGKLVNVTNQNGYVLYFSDHRGMLRDPNSTNGGQTPANIINGEAGLEDVVNSSQNLTSTSPDGVKESATYYLYSPEDADQNGVLDNWGGVNIGYGFGINTSTAPPNPYLTIPAASCNTIGLENAVSGARHVLKLVDGGMNGAGTSYLPVRWDNNGGGFTVAAENPVYVQGNYNSAQSDPFWGGGSNTTPHAAAAIIADAVTVLSNQWSDFNSLSNPTNPGNRSAGNAGQDTYYRMAVAGGKNIPFPQPAWAGNDFGTDGGLHNFLRYLENWGNVNLWYNGSLVSMYYSEYGTGLFKCCTTVYSPPARKYYFDTLFLNPANLPPGTPMFQDVVNLSYHENFTPR